MMPKLVSSIPEREPLSLQQAKDYLRIDTTDEDELIMLFIAAARQQAELITWRALATQTIVAYLDCWPKNGRIRLPRPPLQSVTSIQYILDDDTVETLSASSYRVSTVERGEIVLKSAYSWPTGTLAEINAIAITYTAGYGDPDDIPEIIRRAMYFTLGHYYENRESVVVAPGVVAARIPDTAHDILYQHRAW